MHEYGHFGYGHEHDGQDHGGREHAGHDGADAAASGFEHAHFTPHPWNTFTGTGTSLTFSDALAHPDPLSQCDVFAMQPIDWNHVHIVKPHEVSSYVRADGTVVEGYTRGEGIGYLRSNPDGDPTNNLKP